MFRLTLIFVCLAAIEARNIHRSIRAVDNANATDSSTKAANGSAVHVLPVKVEVESDLVAPSPGDKPLVAKYTIHVTPKLKDGVPQIQEVRIMPPHRNTTQGFTKPLMVLKQNITKPMTENIEIDIPKKGLKFSTKPIVEVIEGKRKEMLRVTKGKVHVPEVVENPVQKSTTKTEVVSSTNAFQPEAAKPEKGFSESNVTNTQQNKTASPQIPAHNTSPNQTASQTQAPAAQAATAVPAALNAVLNQTAVQTQSQAQAASAVPAAAQAQAPAVQAAPAVPAAQAQAPAVQAASAAPAAVQTQAPAAPAARTTVYNGAAAQTQSPAPAPPVASAYYQPAPAATCTDDGRCQIYPNDRCVEQWLTTNCRLKCNLC